MDLSTGLFVLDKTDLVLPDVLPITVTRTYRTLDPALRAFGIGSTHSYDLYLQRNDVCSEVRLILPDGGRIRYLRTSGTNCYDATLVHTRRRRGSFNRRSPGMPPCSAGWCGSRMAPSIASSRRIWAPSYCRPHPCQFPSRHPVR